MKMCFFAVLVTAWSSVAGDSGGTANDEHKKLDGTWVVESVLPDPREKDPDVGKGIRCTIDGAKVVARLPGEQTPSGRLTIKIDPAGNPKTMDMQPEGEKATILAIYELKGDNLRVCWGPLGKERPTEFAPKPGSGCGLVVLKREKR